MRRKGSREMGRPLLEPDHIRAPGSAAWKADDAISTPEHGAGHGRSPARAGPLTNAQ
jgi:hypothetical protein